MRSAQVIRGTMLEIHEAQCEAMMQCMLYIFGALFYIAGVLTILLIILFVKL